MAYILSIFCVFIGGAGITWTFCKRGSDMGTPRWADDRYFLPSLLKLFLFFIIGFGLPEYLFKLPVGRSDTLVWVLYFGFICGFFSFYIYRRFILMRPADEDSKTNLKTALNTDDQLKKKSLRWQDWLALDYGVLREHLKNNRAKKLDKNKSEN